MVKSISIEKDDIVLNMPKLYLYLQILRLIKLLNYNSNTNIWHVTQPAIESGAMLFLIRDELVCRFFINISKEYILVVSKIK